MLYDDAMKAATRGYKVAPMGQKFFVYYTNELGYRKVSINSTGCYWDDDYNPSPYDKMRVWEVYNKSPMSKVKNFINRAFGKKLKLSSNPA